MNKPTPPPNHQWVETADGSLTLFSDKFQESCHSTSGAKNETILHYIEGCKIKEKIESQKSITILEVGFGLGIGLKTTLDYLKDINYPLTFISLELDEELVEWFRKANQLDPLLSKLTWITHSSYKTLELTSSKIKIIIIVGDARKTLISFLKNNPYQWDAIYQDAFSPKKNPILWTVEWFKFLKDNSHQDVILSTYSSSTSIRKSLYVAGWVLYAGEKFGPKRSSTRACLQGKSDNEILLHLERSPVKPMYDDNIEEFKHKDAP